MEFQFDRGIVAVGNEIAGCVLIESSGQEGCASAYNGEEKQPERIDIFLHNSEVSARESAGSGTSSSSSESDSSSSSSSSSNKSLYTLNMSTLTITVKYKVQEIKLHFGLKGTIILLLLSTPTFTEQHADAQNLLQVVLNRFMETSGWQIYIK